MHLPTAASINITKMGVITKNKTYELTPQSSSSTEMPENPILTKDDDTIVYVYNI